MKNREGGPVKRRKNLARAELNKFRRLFSAEKISRSKAGADVLAHTLRKILTAVLKMTGHKQSAWHERANARAVTNACLNFSGPPAGFSALRRIERDPIPGLDILDSDRRFVAFVEEIKIVGAGLEFAEVEGVVGFDLFLADEDAVDRFDAGDCVIGHAAADDLGRLDPVFGAHIFLFNRPDFGTRAGELHFGNDGGREAHRSRSVFDGGSRSCGGGGPASCRLGFGARGDEAV